MSTLRPSIAKRTLCKNAFLLYTSLPNFPNNLLAF